MKIKRYNPLKFIIYGFTVFFFASCSLDNETLQDYERWTSSDPLAINHRAREQKYVQGNLLINSSFETGKLLAFDSITHTTKMDGWDLIGKDVKWIHPGSDSLLADSSKVHEGVGSIQIIRTHANETEEYGEGVFSNYIKVIPGNYQLSLYLKLKNIKNLKSRFGTRIYDAIDIRVICYDRNKIQIDGDFSAPYYNTTIDNSFKGLSFSNFNTIDSTGWIHIIGRSHLFPFPEGDLQDEAKFVRIFIGLKGTGEMWIDDVSFNYTQWNFTQLERLMPYLDTTLEKSKLITPQPRNVKIRESIIYYRPYYKNLFPVILVAESADGLTLQAANMLEIKIRKLLVNLTDLKEEDIPGLIKTSNTFRQDEASIIFSLGLTNELKKNTDVLSLESIKGKKKGYVIQTPDNTGSIIFIYGNSPEANYYAVQTALQLFDSKRLLFHNADIIDYPANEDFGVLLLSTSEETVKFLKKNRKTRFGSVYLSGDDANTYRIFNNERLFSTYERWLYTANSDILQSRDFRRILGTLNGVALVYDNIPTDINIETIINNFNQPPPSREINEVYQKGFSDFIQRAKTLNLNLEVMAPFSSNQVLQKMIYRTSFCNSKIWKDNSLSFIWNGYQYQSWQIDEADLMYIKQFTQEPLVFFDYTLLPCSEALGYFANDPAYPYKLLTSSLFEPFANEVLPEVYQGVSKTVIVYKYSNIFDRIRLQTASDFFWNPDSYNPDLSLFKVLVSEFGYKNTRSLIYFNDYYFKVKSDILLAGIQKNPHKFQRRIAVYMKEIQTILDQLKDNTTESGQELLQVINDLMIDLEQQLENSGLMIKTN